MQQAARPGSRIKATVSANKPLALPAEPAGRRGSRQPPPASPEATECPAASQRIGPVFYSLILITQSGILFTSPSPRGSYCALGFSWCREALQAATAEGTSLAASSSSISCTRVSHGTRTAPRMQHPLHPNKRSTTARGALQSPPDPLGKATTFGHQGHGIIKTRRARARQRPEATLLSEPRQDGEQELEAEDTCQDNVLWLAPCTLPEPPCSSRPMSDPGSQPGPPGLEFYSWRWSREQQT